MIQRGTAIEAALRTNPVCDPWPVPLTRAARRLPEEPRQLQGTTPCPTTQLRGSTHLIDRTARQQPGPQNGKEPVSFSPPILPFLEPSAGRRSRQAAVDVVLTIQKALTEPYKAPWRQWTHPGHRAVGCASEARGRSCTETAFIPFNLLLFDK